MSYNIHFPTEKLLLNHSSSQFQSWPMQGCPFLCGIQLSFKSILFIKYTVPHPKKASSIKTLQLHIAIKKVCIFILNKQQPGCLSFWNMKRQEVYSVLVHIWAHQIPWLLIQKQIDVQHLQYSETSYTNLEYFTNFYL